MQVGQDQVETVDAGLADDGALLGAYARNGDEAAFRELVRRHAGWLYAAAYRQLGEAQGAEDAAQAVFVLLCQRAKKLAGKAGSAGGGTGTLKVSGWLFMTVSYTVRSMKRAQRRRRMHEMKAALERPESVAEVKPPLAGELDEAVARLGAEDRAAIVLRYYRKMEFADVGRALGVSPEAARQRVSRAVARLRGKLHCGRVAAGGAALTTEDIAAAGAFGVPSEAALTTLSAHLASVALGTAGGVGVTAGVGSAMKGAAYLMAMTKAKIVAVTAIIVLVTGTVAVSTGVAIWRMSAAQTAAAPAVAPSGAAAQPFEEAYALQPSAVVRVIKPPFPESRMVFYRTQSPTQAKAAPGGPDAMVVAWKDGQPIMWGMAFAGGRGGYTLADLVGNYFGFNNLGYSEVEIEDLTGLATRPIMGDIVRDWNPPKDQYRAALEKIASEEFGVNIVMEDREVERPVIVLKGEWKLVPAAGKVAAQVEFYGAELDADSQAGGVGQGDIQALVRSLNDYIRKQVVIEATGVPETVLWHMNMGNDQSPAGMERARDPELVLKHIEDQTGLTRTVETRKVRRLFITKQGGAPGAAGGAGATRP